LPAAFAILISTKAVLYCWLGVIFGVELIDALLMVGVLILIEGLLWFHSDKLYEFHRRLKENYPVVFSIIGSGPQYLASKEQWTKHSRIGLILFFLLVISLLLFQFFG
jgi:hypothetical protein